MSRAKNLDTFRKNLLTQTTKPSEVIEKIQEQERDLYYFIEKITHQKVDDEYYTMKVEMFKEAFANDPEYKKDKKKQSEKNINFR
tara:strand:- start:326 stop:580 length:255 start_codon:yes stop_codon:yes gene_type:complete